MTFQQLIVLIESDLLLNLKLRSSSDTLDIYSLRTNDGWRLGELIYEKSTKISRVTLFYGDTQICATSNEDVFSISMLMTRSVKLMKPLVRREDGSQVKEILFTSDMDVDKILAKI
jgi:hypothetical protein